MYYIANVHEKHPSCSVATAIPLKINDPSKLDDFISWILNSYNRTWGWSNQLIHLRYSFSFLSLFQTNLTPKFFLKGLNSSNPYIHKTTIQFSFVQQDQLKLLEQRWLQKEEQLAGIFPLEYFLTHPNKDFRSIASSFLKGKLKWNA